MELRKPVRDLERTLGRKTYELEILGKRISVVGVRQRVAYARELAAAGHKPAALARILQISRQAIHRVPATRPMATGSSPLGCKGSWGGRSTASGYCG